jgi:hypothetical protein
MVFTKRNAIKVYNKLFIQILFETNSMMINVFLEEHLPVINSKENQKKFEKNNYLKMIFYFQVVSLFLR